MERAPLERTLPSAFGPEETQRVLRRAAELDREQAPAAPALRLPDEPVIDAAELERIASESGLSPEAVRRALHELNGGALTPRPGPTPAAAAGRMFSERPELIEERLTAAMLRGGLSPIHVAPHSTRWVPSAGVGQTLARAVDLDGRGAWLGATVASSVYAVAGERSSAELQGEVRDLAADDAVLRRPGGRVVDVVDFVADGAAMAAAK